MRRTVPVLFALLALAACGGGGSGGGGGGGSFAGFATPHPLAISPGGVADKRFGAAIAALDWNRDGRVDIVVGAPGATANAGATVNAGAVHLFTGQVGGGFTLAATFTSSTWSVAPEAGAFFGEQVAAGDVDGDGFLDLVIGAPGATGGAIAGAGAVYVLFNTVSPVGDPRGPFADPAGPEAGADFGAQLAVRDVTGDLKADVVVGAPSATVAAQPLAGQVSILFGATPAGFGVATAGPFSDPTPEAASFFGASIVLADVATDGLSLPDVVIGAPGASMVGPSTGGEVHVYRNLGGGSFGFAVTLTASLTGIDVEFGASIAAGDFDGDGRIDLAVGAPFEDGPSEFEVGAVVMLRNTNSATPVFSVAQVLRDTSALQEFGAEFGAQVVVADLDGDGDPDLAVGAPAATVSLEGAAGRLSLFRGDGDVTLTALSSGAVSDTPTEGAGFAARVVSLDPNGTIPARDFVVGAPGPADGPFQQAGRVEVLRQN